MTPNNMNPPPHAEKKTSLPGLIWTLRQATEIKETAYQAFAYCESFEAIVTTAQIYNACADLEKAILAEIDRKTTATKVKAQAIVKEEGKAEKQEPDNSNPLPL